MLSPQLQLVAAWMDWSPLCGSTDASSQKVSPSEMGHKKHKKAVFQIGKFPVSVSPKGLLFPCLFFRSAMDADFDIIQAMKTLAAAFFGRILISSLSTLHIQNLQRDSHFISHSRLFNVDLILLSAPEGGPNPAGTGKFSIFSQRSSEHMHPSNAGNRHQAHGGASLCS